MASISILVLRLCMSKCPYFIFSEFTVINLLEDIMSMKKKDSKGICFRARMYYMLGVPENFFFYFVIFHFVLLALNLGFIFVIFAYLSFNYMRGGWKGRLTE